MTGDAAGVVDCFHCGLPVPHGFHAEVVVLGAPRPMCCHGCAAVAATLEEQGLSDYYRHRTEIPLTPAELPSSLDAELERVEAAGLADELSPLDEEGLRASSLLVDDMRCAACAWLIEERLRQETGVERASVNLGTHVVHVAFDPEATSLGGVIRALHDVGYRARPRRPDALAEHRQREHRRALVRLGVSGLGAMNVMSYAAALYAGAFVGMEARYETLFRWVSLLVSTPVILVAGEPFFRAAWRDLRARRPGMDVPIALAMGSAYLASAWATWSGTGEVYFDSVCMFAFFLTLGRSIEMWVRHGSGDATDRLLQAEPETACRVAGGREEWVPAAALEAGDRVLVRPGEAIPCDGRIVEGSTSVGESLLTGEPWPRDAGPGERVYGGSTNVDQPIVVEATRAGRETMLAAIVALLERAQSETPPVVLRADRVARWFVTGVLVIAAVTAIVWLRIAPDRAFEVTLAVLVATCPCALSLATPVALAAAQSALARAGFLVTRGHVVEALAEIRRLLLDKTGTLTRGEPTLVETIRLRADEERDVLALAARLEAGSEHPVATALLRALAESGATAWDAVLTERQAVHGSGIEAEV
ncbi:MAG: heavy metal translocating P-type ATPase, partial [Actinomycetota bacterium]|nr:heavy metal translocating P-type ATPase [Actinomycetota bacterium]